MAAAADSGERQMAPLQFVLLSHNYAPIRGITEDANLPHNVLCSQKLKSRSNIQLSVLVSGRT